MSKKILIIEDEKALLNALVDKFVLMGIRVMTADDGRKGLRAALKYHPDLILLDVIMPVMDGVTMLGKLRKDEWGKQAKVTLLTNLSDTGKLSETCELKACDYLVKSDWKILDVVNKVKNKLEEK